LKPLKSKPAAKKELLRAFGRGREIVVPSHIVAVERELMSEYARANVAAKEEYEREKRERVEAEKNRLLKRKREDDEVLKSVKEVEARRSKKEPTTVLDLDKVAGRYDVVAPYLRDNYGASDGSDSYSLAIAPASGGKAIWGDFDFGSFEGYLRSTSIDKTARTITFNWRGRENGEGESTFGDNNIIEITFLDDKTFEGYAEGDFFEQCEISGRYESKGGNPQHNVNSWVYQYESLDEDNYERERVARWH
jgi:hypothetical protein